MRWYAGVFKKYAVFSGRARRREFWMYSLFNFLALVVLAGIGLSAHTTTAMIPYYIYAAAMLVPSLAVTARRLHDIGHSGWLMLIGLIPVLGEVAMLAMTCSEGEAEPNAFGPNPKSAPAHL